MTLLRNGVAVLFLSMQMLLKPGDKDNNQKRQAVMNELTRANREAATKSKYIRDSFAIRLEKAKSGEQRNFGGQVPRWLKWDKNAKKYVPHPEKWGTVQRIVSEVIAQKMWGHIVRDLNAAKVPCLLGGKRWQHASVYQLVRNPALRGDFHGLVGYVPAVVNPAQWDLLQARLAVSNKRGGGSRNSDKIPELVSGSGAL